MSKRSKIIDLRTYFFDILQLLPGHRVQHADEERGEDEEEGDIDGDDDLEVRGLKYGIYSADQI